MEHRRRITDRRKGIDRRALPRGDIDIACPPSWPEQRAQYITRYLFWALGLAYFNLGELPRTSGWLSIEAINIGLALYGLLVSFFMWHARRTIVSPRRWRAAMWVDLGTVSFAVMADPVVLSPGFLAYIMVILGNGMRYGLRFFAEAVVGSFFLVMLILTLRFSDYFNAISLNSVFFPLIGVIIVLYTYSLTAGLEKARKQLEIERNIDDLTGLLNRRAFYEKAGHLFRSLGDNGDSLVVLFADLDRFKAVNDTQGHHIGDRVLSAIAKMVATSVRASDIVARYGGDEFVLILPGTDLDRGTVVARRLQDALADWSKNNGINLSFSIGMGEALQHGDDVKSVIERVDKAMYRSKLTHGRGGIQYVEQTLPA